MPRFLKILILAIYGLFQKNNTDVALPPKPDQRKFIKKYSWFFEWHRFFWILGRRWFPDPENKFPVLADDGDELRRHMGEYYELAMRDFIALSLHDKIMHPTRYELAPDAARALCMMYGSTMRIAPFQYGANARLLALRKMRKVCIVSFLIFILACFTGTAGSVFSAWFVLIALLAFMLSGVGWYADSCLLHMAEVAEQLHKGENTP